MKIILFILLTVSSVASARTFHLVTVRFDEHLAAWIPKSRVTGLTEVERALLNRNWPLCSRLARKAFWSYPSVRAWVLAVQVQCETNQFNKSRNHDSRMVRPLTTTLKYGWGRSKWLLNGPQANELRVNLVGGTLSVLDAAAKGPRINVSQAEKWSLINSILAARSWLNASEQIRLYGDVSAISKAEGHPQTAVQYAALVQKLTAPVNVVSAPTNNSTPPGPTLFEKAMTEFQQKEYSDAAADFEKYLASGQTADNLSAMYWSWRAYQKMNSSKAQKAVARLISNFPLSYYGLRAQSELSKSGNITFPEKFAHPVRYVLALRQPEWQAWNNYLLFIKAGWFKQAQAEIRSFVAPATLAGELIYAKLFSSAHDYQTAAQYLTLAFAQDPKVITIEALKTIYPDAYHHSIDQASHRFGLSTVLVQAVIKQESSYDPNAVSPAGAIGLMQLMPVTAEQLARDMYMPLRNVSSDLTEPKINILLGADYLHRELHDFNNNLPLALAAYNAGIGNVRNWLQSRPDASSIKTAPTSDPTSELWFDELPWRQTRQYIQSILRNILLYRMLDQHSRRLDLSEKSVVFHRGF